MQGWYDFIFKTYCSKDFEAGRYDSYYLNFISPISREYLEEIAQTALSENCVHQISKVFDQYTNFICLEDDLLTLSSPIDGPSSFYGEFIISYVTHWFYIN